MRNIQKNILGQLGFTDIIEACDGVEALQVVQSNTPDLMLVDWNMPNMDGITFVREFRETDTTTPIIMVTTEAEKGGTSRRSKPGSTTIWSSPSPPIHFRCASRRPWAKPLPELPSLSAKPLAASLWGTMGGVGDT
jgi:two-component system chemotaxis response regulator CheY